jgi:hypothetical protein
LTKSGARKASEIVILTFLHAAALSRSDLLDSGHGARNNFIEPAPATGN